VVSTVTRDKIDRKARVWTVTLGRDGRLAAELDAKRVAALRLAAWGDRFAFRAGRAP
jgi:hypothetical protein